MNTKKHHHPQPNISQYSAIRTTTLRPSSLNFSNESDSDEISPTTPGNNHTNPISIISPSYTDYRKYWKSSSSNLNKSRINGCYKSPANGGYNHRRYNHSNAASSTLSSSSLSSSNNETSSGDLNRFRILTYEQVRRLHEILNTEMAVHSRLPEMPTIRVQLKSLFIGLKHALNNEGIKLRDIKFNGGLASHIISTNRETPFNDVDVLLSVDLSSSASTMCRVKTIVLNELMKFIPDKMIPEDNNNLVNIEAKKSSSMQTNVNNLSESSSQFFTQDYNLQESYIFKQFRMFSQESDCWSLLALGCPTPNSKVIELKFVDRMKRQYEFTVDSFQIQLDSLLTYYTKHCDVEENFYPTVVAESVSGSFQDALYHLEEKFIVTYNPESIRGGGLLKYCKLIVEGYRPGEDINIALLERYMCSRFFIDFTDLHSQRVKLESYLNNHFQPHDEETLIRYLTTFFHVVNGSTVCLMSQDHYNILETVVQIIHNLINRIQTRNKAIRLNAFSGGEETAGEFELDRIYYGDRYFPVNNENNDKI